MTDEANTLIDALQSPDAYPHEVRVIELRETHISWVLLTGPYAYKIKKPVRFEFLDFSTLEQRHRYCQEELRLNLRLALDLYIDVVPIVGTADKPRIGGLGTPIEYAVRMHQFPQESLLSTRIAEGSLMKVHVDRLAAEVAEFHQSLPPAPVDCRYATPDLVFREAVENLDLLQNTVTDARLLAILVEVRDWTEREFSWRHTDLENRKRRGFVRECHGDMHLGNMVLIAENVVIFDGIEFNPEFRWIDVMNEVAFVTMDLEDRGRSDFAHRFLNSYLERTGDYAGMSVLPFYLVYRALVRAKVAAIRCGQEQHRTARRELQAELAAYVRLASQYTHPRDRRLLITHGVSGSGKTTGTTALIDELGVIRVRSDVERKRLYEVGRHDRATAGPEEGMYSAEATERTYNRLAECTEQILHGGFPALVDATFLKAAHRDRFRRMAEDWQVPFEILDFSASEDILRGRLRRRSADADEVSDADEQVLEYQLATREPLSRGERRFVRQLTDLEGADGRHAFAAFRGELHCESEHMPASIGECPRRPGSQNRAR